jgi:alcohol dehydrogenase class IV
MGVMVQFEFATATRIIFGLGEIGRIGALASEYGGKALLIAGKNLSRAKRLIAYLEDRSVQVIIYQIEGEPTVQEVKEGADFARQNQAELVIGMGGGSVLDAGKAISALATNNGDIYEYLEIIGKGSSLKLSPLPYIAIPTTAGTGSEVTRNAVLGSPEQGLKVSMRSAMMIPRVALVDPELTFSVPTMITASTGLDALTQLIEPFVSAHSNPLTDAICRQGIGFVSRSLRIAAQDGGNAVARQEMALASLFGGLALANAKLGAVHGFAGVLGGKYSAPHGAICARLLPEVMRVNVRALTERDPENVAIVKYRELAQIVTGDPGASIMDGIDWVENLCADLGSKGLSSFGIKPAHFGDLIPKAQNASSMKGNPIRLTEQELGEILKRGLVDY